METLSQERNKGVVCKYYIMKTVLIQLFLIDKFIKENEEGINKILYLNFCSRFIQTFF